MIKISRSAAGVWNNLEDTNSTKIYFRILAKIAKENWKVIDNNEIVVATSPSPFLLESFSSTSSEADLFVPIENEPLINNGNDISTNELVAIIPQANLIDTSFIAPDVDIAGPLDDDIHNSNSGDNDDVVTISGEIILQFSLPISRSAAGVWNNLEDTNSTKIYFRILAKIAKENWKVIDNNEIVVATSPSPFLLESFSSTSSEADLFVPIENEPLINNGNDISTNELVAIIPQANLIDSMIDRRR
ncbi:15505_t:CDS:2 [Entrophospora sp. SA101]|nr:15505_t:CDS:2 [Entrophospora sp. SA101]